MAICFLPTIAPGDYSAFQRILTDAPATHEGWHRYSVKTARAARQAGKRIEHVDVGPTEFAQYCDDGGSARNLKSLLAFAVDKGSPQAPRSGGPAIPLGSARPSRLAATSSFTIAFAMAARRLRRRAATMASRNFSMTISRAASISMMGGSRTSALFRSLANSVLSSQFEQPLAHGFRRCFLRQFSVVGDALALLSNRRVCSLLE
jgi:hypothetical protein